MIVVVDQPGRLGNRLQLAAYALAFGLEHGRTVAPLCLQRHARYFAGSRRDWLFRIPSRRADGRPGPTWLAEPARAALRALAALPLTPTLRARHPPGLILDHPTRPPRLPPGPLLLLCGYYFYAPRWLTKHAAAIREYFQLVEPHRSRVARFLDRARGSAPVLVGVHVRHGDYVSYRGGKHFFTAAQYARVMRRTGERLGRDVHFVVCSDSEQPPEHFAGLSWQSGPGSDIEDLYALAGCDLVLGPFSTFNRWSAFVGNVPRYELHDAERAVSLEDYAPVQHLTAPPD